MLSAHGAGGVAIAAGFGWLSAAWAGFGDPANTGEP
jgi:hypothetical protein